jgi:hypothetical protein
MKKYDIIIKSHDFIPDFELTMKAKNDKELEDKFYKLYNTVLRKGDYESSMV